MPFTKFLFAPSAVLDSEARRANIRLRNKLDLHILPFLSLLYLVNFLDRTNIGNAKIAGLVQDVHLTGIEFNIGLTVFYILYIGCQLPSNWLLKRVGPNRWLAILTCVWSVITISTGFIESFGGLVAVRFLLGACEGGILPGVILYLSTLYTRHELQTRIALFWAPATIAGAFGGLLASAIIHMDGVGGLAGWRWIFILEGVASFMVGLLLFFALPNDLHSMRFLTPAERDLAILRLKVDLGGADHLLRIASRTSDPARELPKENESAGVDVKSDFEKAVISQEAEAFEWREVRRGIFDIHTWLVSLSYFGGYTSLSSLAYFVPTIISGLGFTGSEAQLLTVPPYILATIATVGVSMVCDRWKMRMPVVMVLYLIAISGYALAIAAKTDQMRYGALFLMALGVYPTAPTILAVIPNNTNGHYKRATSIAMSIGIACTGGFLSTFIYTPDQAPHYIRGHSLVLGLLCASFVLSGLAVIHCLYENRMRATGLRDNNIAAYRALWDTGKTRAPIGDRHPDFRLTL